MTDFNNFRQHDSEWNRIPKLFERDDFSKMIHALESQKQRSPNNPYGATWLTKRDTCILAILYHMGLRPKECVRLRFSDFIPKTLSFHIRGVNNHSNKDRVMPIPKEVFKYLEEYLFFGRKSDWLFPSFTDLTKPLSSGRWKTIMREYILRPAGLYIPGTDGKMPLTRSYSLRASFAVRVLKKSNNAYIVQEALGHKDWRTMKHYLRLASVNDENNMEVMRQAMTEAN